MNKVASDGKPLYRFDGKETCVWNHYAHEGISIFHDHKTTMNKNILIWKRSEMLAKPTNPKS